jgi:hypothetical protein
MKKMKLTREEKSFIDKISAISGYDSHTVKGVFSSLLISAALEMWSGKKKISIPYLFNFSVEIDPKYEGTKYQEGFYDVETNPSFNNVLSKLNEREDSVVEEYLKREISRHLADLLDLDACMELDEEYLEKKKRQFEESQV